MTAIRGKRVLVTGAGHGLGRAIALQFARTGAELIVTDLDAKRSNATVDELRGFGASAFGYQFDVTAPEEVLAARARIHAEIGPVDVLVNNAGIVCGGPFLDVPLSRHQLTVAVNLQGVLNVTHAFLPDLIARNGHLVNVASASAVIALPWAASYAATKWAVLGFTDSLREELRMQGHAVRVTAVCPSYIDTGLFAGAKPPRHTRFLTPDEVAAKVLRAVEHNREFVLLPGSVAWLYALGRMLPRALFRRLCRWLGVSTSMTGWKGHAGA